MVSFFHSYDLRGKYPDEISQEEAVKVGKAYGTWLETEKVMVARDGRNHSEKISESFKQGLISTGKTVVDIGQMPSPVLYYGVKEKSFEAGAVVTASHNPSEYTGFKFCGKNAMAISREGGMKQIEEIYRSGNFETGEGTVETLDIKNEYIEFIESNVDLEKNLEVAVNYGNAVTANIADQVLETVGCSLIEVNKEVDGNFPNHLPDPGDEEAQEQLRKVMDDSNLGIIFDGDGDRAGFIVPGYGYVEPDKVIALLSEELLKHGKGKVFHDLRASKLVPETVEKHGGAPKEMRVGHTFFSEAIHNSDEKVVFGGELSGHYYFPGIDAPWDDGILAAALMCKITSEINLSQKLEEYPDYPVSPELRIDCPENAKQDVVQGVKKYYSGYEMETVDGVKIKFENGWSLIRPSSTEEKMSVRTEADTEEDLQSIRTEVEQKVRELIEKNS